VLSIIEARSREMACHFVGMGRRCMARGLLRRLAAVTGGGATFAQPGIDGDGVSAVRAEDTAGSARVAGGARGSARRNAPPPIDASGLGTAIVDVLRATVHPQAAAVDVTWGCAGEASVTLWMCG
jgi:hypothetical protein